MLSLFCLTVKPMRFFSPVLPIFSLSHSVTGCVGAWLLAGASPPQCHRLALNLRPFFFFFVMCCWWLSFYTDAKLNCSTEIIKKITHEKEMDGLKYRRMLCENKLSRYSARSGYCVMLIYKGRKPLFLLIEDQSTESY